MGFTENSFSCTSTCAGVFHEKPDFFLFHVIDETHP